MGADIGLHVGGNFTEEWPDRSYKASIFKLMNDHKLLGEKTGAGFYTFETDKCVACCQIDRLSDGQAGGRSIWRCVRRFPLSDTERLTVNTSGDGFFLLKTDECASCCQTARLSWVKSGAGFYSFELHKCTFCCQTIRGWETGTGCCSFEIDNCDSCCQTIGLSNCPRRNIWCYL